MNSNHYYLHTYVSTPLVSRRVPAVTHLAVGPSAAAPFVAGVLVAYFVVSFGTTPWPLFTVVSTFTDVSLLMIVVSRVILGVITVSLAVPTRSVCP
jgi:hypothetical protein